MNKDDTEKNVVEKVPLSAVPNTAQVGLKILIPALNEYQRMVTVTAPATLIPLGSGTSNIDVTADLSGLLPETIYNFRVVAINSTGTTYGVNQTFTTLPPPIVLPNAPTKLNATPVAFSVINLTWTDTSNNETMFIIARKTSCQDPFIPIATVNADITSYSDAELNPATFYFYQVKASNDFGDSEYSNMARAITWADIPTIEKLIGLLNSYQDQFKNDGIHNSLLVKLQAAQYSISIKDYQSALGQLGAFTNEIEAQTDKSFSSEVAEALLTTVQPLIEYVTLIVSLPTTLDLYLSEEPCVNEVTIEIPTGGVVKTTLSGYFKVQLESTTDPDIATFNITQSSYIGTPLVVNGLSSETLYFSEDPNNPSTGTLNLKNGKVDFIERVLVRSDYLNVLGLSPVALEIPQTGTFSPMSLTKGILYSIGKGTMPGYLPILGGASYLVYCISPVSPPPPKPEKPKVDLEWTGVVPKVNLTITRKDNVLTETFTTPLTTTNVILNEEHRLFLPGYGYISFFEAKVKGLQTIIGYTYGKSVIIDMIPTTEHCKGYDYIQVVSDTIISEVPGAEPIIFTEKWHFNGVKNFGIDPTFGDTYPNGKGGRFLFDIPGRAGPKQPWEPPHIKGSKSTFLFEFNTWLINTEPFEIIGFYKWSFILTIIVGESEEDTIITIEVPKPPAEWAPTPKSWWEPVPPEEGRRYIDKLKEGSYPPKYYEKYEKKGKK